MLKVIANKYCAFALLLVLSACAQTTTVHGTYHPVVIMQGVDSRQYEVDRSLCEVQVKAKPSNLESTNHIRFRECLISKGYKLMS